jgi:hypothetical protein
VDGKIATIMKAEDAPELKEANQTNEQVRANLPVNLFRMALELRLSITRYDAQNKYRLFLVSLIVTSTIIILTYLNALLQHILGTGNFVNILKILSTILGFKYKKEAATCLANELIYFICLFLLLAYDVYVIRVIASLEKEIENKIANIDNKEEIKLKQSPDKDFEEGENAGLLGARRSVLLAAKMLAEDKSDDSDMDSEEEEMNANESDGMEILNNKSLLNNLEDILKEDSQRVGIMLLDSKDLEEIIIQAYRKGENQGLINTIKEVRGPKFIDYDQLVKRVDYQKLARIDFYRWNFYEFYEVTNSKDEDQFKNDILDIHKKKKGVGTDSESEDEEDEGGHDGKIKLLDDEEDKRKDIVNLVDCSFQT